jgi:hypothetical protein
MTYRESSNEAASSINPRSTSMTEDEEQAEPPSRMPIFMVGQDSRGNWVVRDRSGIRGGLFVNRAEALRYVRFESGNCPQAPIPVIGIFELDMSRTPAATPQRQSNVDAQRERRVA